MKSLLGPFAILLLRLPGPLPPFWHQRDLCWGLYFPVLSEIMFTKRLFLSVGHPVSVLFGQRGLLLGKAIHFLPTPRALFQKEAWKAISTFRVWPGPVRLIGVDVPSWVNDPCPLLGHQKKERTVTVIRILRISDWVPQSGWIRGRDGRLIFFWPGSHLTKRATP